jgi:ABC-type nickel/cobalt efflux system permease component RcnA
MPQLKHLPSGPYTLTDVLLVWSMILVVFTGFWLLNRYLKRAQKKRPYAKRLTERLQTRKKRHQ